MNEKRFNTLNEFYRKKFGTKIIKCSLDAGFTCPNRDGTKDYKGCIFCTRTPYIGDVLDPLEVQFEKIKNMLHKKWKDGKYIIYLEAGSNTYATLDVLKNTYEPLIKLDNVVGLNIGTRCDCLTTEILDYLEDLSKRTSLTVELGLQSANPSTLKLINRHHTKEEFSEAIKELKKRNISVVVHIINGLPGETIDDMIDTVKYLNGLSIDGIKIHMLYLEKGSILSKMYEEEPFHILSKTEYIMIVSEQLKYLSKNIVIHRITSDPDKDKVIEPTWLLKKFIVLNDIDKYLREKNITQGMNLEIERGCNCEN